MSVITLLSGATATGEGPTVTVESLRYPANNRTIQAIGSVTASTGSATITVEASNDGTNWVVLDTLSLTLGTTVTTDWFESTGMWDKMRANVTVLSGTGASVSVYMGV